MQGRRPRHRKQLGKTPEVVGAGCDVDEPGGAGRRSHLLIVSCSTVDGADVAVPHVATR